MVESKTDALVKSLGSLVAEKEAVTSKEKELIDGLNAVLSHVPRLGETVQWQSEAHAAERGRMAS